jgi:PAS domain S-box-containing protein
MNPSHPVAGTQDSQARRDYNLPDGVPQQLLDDLTVLASHLADAPVAVITLVAHGGAWIKSSVGLSPEINGAVLAFAPPTMAATSVLMVPDMRRDARFATHPLVTEPPHLRFYAGVRLVSSAGDILGTLAVMDRSPRSLTTPQQRSLDVLGQQVVAQIELRRHARDLAESERRLRTIFDNEPECVKLMSRNAELLDINPAGLRMIEADSMDQVIGRSLLDLVVPDHRALFLEFSDAVIGGASSTLEFEIVTLKGTRRWVETHAAPLPDADGVINILGITREVTARRIAAAHIQQLNRVYAILGEINQTILRETVSTRLLDSACRIAVEKGRFRMAWIGLRTADREGQRVAAHAGADDGTLNLLRAMVEPGNPFGCSVTAQALHTGQHVVCNDIANDQRAAPWRAGALARDYRAMAALPLVTRQGVIGTFNLYAPESGFFDTDEVGLLLELASNIAFALELHEQHRERQHLEEQLRQSQKMEAIGQLAGGVAHDFNNILTVIHGYGSMLMGPERDRCPEDQHAARQIVDACERATSLTRQLLAFGRRQVMQPRRVDVNELARGLTQMMQRVLGEDVRLQLTLNPRSLITRADAVMLDQVLINLMVNAREAMPHGGVLTIETSEVVVGAQPTRGSQDPAPGSYVSVRVSDTGQGISPEHLPRIFEPFFTTKEPGKGTGLGLATVFGIVKQHGGTITVESGIGQGTTFRILLPAEPAGTAAVAVDAGQGEPRGGTEMILVVEDEPSVRRLTRVLLEGRGYRVVEASSGVDALRVWEQHGRSIDLLLTDIVMPEGLSGRDLAARLHALRPDLPVVFTSGYSADIAGRELSLLEGQNFLQKPFTRPELLHIVRRSLDGTR